MGIQINGNTDNISATDGGLTVSDLEINQSGISTFNNALNIGTGSSIFSPAANTFTLGTNSNERLRIASDGNMGLGTNSLVGNAANVYLTVNGSTLGGIALKANGTNQGYLQGTSSLIRLSSDGSKPITFDTNGSERLRIDSNGRLNHHSGTIVGGTLPYAYFSPPTSSYGGVNLTMNLHDPASEAIGKGGGLGFSAVGSSGNAVVRAAIRGNVEATTSEAGYLTLHTRTNGGGNDERLRIDSSGRVMIGTTIEGNTNADDLTVANSGEGGITIRSGSSSNGNIFFSDATSGAGEYAGIIDYKHSSNVMTFGISGTERLRITEGGVEQATLVIDNAGTNGNTWIGDNYTANATEHTCTIGNMYSGAGFFLGYNMKPQSDGWGFVSSQDAYSDRRAGMTLNGSGYDALRIDVTNANQTITTGDPVTTVKAFAVKHNGDVEIPDGNLVVASGHGVDFSATGNSSGNATAELFDDYEEGTFVPGTPNYAATGKTAQYTKIGNTVHYQIQLSGISGSASFIVSNLPFAVNAGWGGTIGISDHGGQDHFYTFPHQGMTSLYVRTSSNSTYGTTNSRVAGKFFYIWGTYITNA